jgi:Uma2 family endonuclease
MSREEFWRRYEQRHDLRHAEHINGVVYVPSPIRSDVHSEPLGVMTRWLARYDWPEDTLFLPTPTVLLPTDDTVEPDIAIVTPGVSARINEDGYLEGAPDLVVEVAYSSASHDLHAKKDAYEASGVREYIVWSTWDRTLNWFRLEGGAFQHVEPVDGRIESTLFAGLVLDVDALLGGDYAAVLRGDRSSS